MQTVPYEFLEALREPFEVGFLLGDTEHQGVHPAVGRAERQRARRRVGEDRAEAEHVAGRGDPVAAHLLGGHEAGRAHEGARSREAAVRHGLQGAGDAEVDDAGPVDRHQDVRRLQVAVDEARGVDVLERVREARREDPHGALGQRAVVVRDDRLQRGPRHVTRGHPGDVRLGVRVEDRRGPLPADLPRGPHLEPEPVPELLLLGELLAHQLDRDRAPAVRARQIDLAHPARPEPRQQPVRTDALRISRPQLLHVAPPSPICDQHPENSGRL